MNAVISGRVRRAVLGAGEDHPVVGALGGGDPHLAAVQNPLVALPHCPRLDVVAGIRAAGGLGDRHESALLAFHAGHAVAGDLLCRAAPNDVRRPAAEGTERRRIAAQAALRGFLGDHHPGEGAHWVAAVLFGHGEPSQPHRFGLRPQLGTIGRRAAGSVVRQLVFDRLHLLAHEAADLIAQQHEFVRQGEAVMVGLAQLSPSLARVWLFYHQRRSFATVCADSMDAAVALDLIWRR